MAWYGGLFGIVALICAVWVIYDVAVVQKSWSTEKKLLWIILAILFSILTAIVYYFMFKAKR